MERNLRMISKRVPLTSNRLPFNRDFIGGTVPERFEFVVRQIPQLVAVNDMGSEYTYHEINSRSNILADKISRIEGNIGNQNNAVALILGHKVDIIVGMMGTLKAGCFFTSIAPSLPQKRISYLLNDSRANIIITTQNILKQIENQNIDDFHIITMDNIHWDQDIDFNNFTGNPDQISALIYTSGSTGEPKGVIRTHGNLLHSAWWSGDFYSINTDDRVSEFSSFSHGNALHSAFRALLNGGSLCLFDLKNRGLHQLIPWLQDNDITVCLTPPTTLRQIALLVNSNNCFPSMRLLILGGETIRRSDLQIFNDFFSETTMLRLGGGTTEASVFAACFFQKETPIPDIGIPMGFIIPDTEVLIWDENNNPLPFGELGEIVVRSKFISAGYWRRPELTRKLFLHDLEDDDVGSYKTGDLGILTSEGLLFHKGRKDFQVKIRGYRVEVGEIENILSNFEGIAQVTVSGQSDNAGETFLVAYVIATAEMEGSLSVSDIRKFLVDHLPDYMVPSFYVFLDEFPLTSSGKIDYSRLPKPNTGRPKLNVPYVPARNPTEQILVRIWSDVLSVGSIGVFDEFLMLGGQSLNISQIGNRIENEFNITLSIRQLFELSTISDMAQFISKEIDQND